MEKTRKEYIRGTAQVGVVSEVWSGHVQRSDGGYIPNWFSNKSQH